MVDMYYIKVSSAIGSFDWDIAHCKSLKVSSGVMWLRWFGSYWHLVGRFWCVTRWGRLARQIDRNVGWFCLTCWLPGGVVCGKYS